VESNTLKDLYLDELKDLYDAEHQIIKALPKMIEAASSEELQNALTEHLEISKTYPSRRRRSCRIAGADTERGERGRPEAY
jgi:ferritin-like metal-binding protein YciE